MRSAMFVQVVAKGNVACNLKSFKNGYINFNDVAVFRLGT